MTHGIMPIREWTVGVEGQCTNMSWDLDKIDELKASVEMQTRKVCDPWNYKTMGSKIIITGMMRRQWLVGGYFDYSVNLESDKVDFIKSVYGFSSRYIRAKHNPESVRR